MSNLFFSELMRGISECLPDNLHQASRDMEKNMRVFVQSLLDEFELVPKEEFDAQVRILKEAQDKLAALQAHYEAHLEVCPADSKR